MRLGAASRTGGGWLWYGYCATLLAGAVVPAIPVFAGYLPNGVVAGSGLLLIASGWLLLTTRTPDPAPYVTLAAGTAALPGALLVGISLLPSLVVLLAFPLTLVEVAWQGPLTGVGLLPSGQGLPALLTFDDALALLVLGAACAVAMYAGLRRASSPLEGLAIGGPAAVLMTLAAAGAPWPTLALSTLVAGLGLLVAAGLATLGPWRRTVIGTQGAVFVVSGLLGTLPTRATTVLGLALVAAGAAVVGARGRVQSRISGWLFTVQFLGVTVLVGALALGWPAHRVAYAVLGAAGAALLLGAALRAHRRRESSAVEAGAHAVALVALTLTLHRVPSAQLLCGLWALAAGLRAAWPGTSRSDRRFLLVYSGAWWVFAWWLLLDGWGVTLTEAHTLPVAGLAAAAGWACRRRWPRIRASRAYAAAVAIAILPTVLTAVF